MSAEELLLRKAFVGGSGLIYWAGVLIQARRVQKKIGRSPNLTPRTAKERMLWIGWLLVVAAWIGPPFFAGGENAPAFVRVHAGKRLASLGGKAPTMKDIPRRRPAKNLSR